MESELFKEMCELLEIGKTMTTIYIPSAMVQMIRCCIRDRQKRWDDFVGIALGVIRATRNRSTSFTPNIMMLGRGVMMPLELMLGSYGEEVGRGGTLGPRLGMAGWRHIEKAREMLEGVQRRQKI